MSNSQTLSARWVFPVSGPPLEGGTVTFCGDTIEAVEPHGVYAPDEDLGNVAIIPGLVNVHTHLDLSGARGRIPPTDPEHFTDWLRAVIAYRRGRTPEQVQADVRAGLAECLRAGTTLVGDITSGGACWEAVASAATRAVLFWEVIGLTQERFQPTLHDFGLKAGLAWDHEAPPAVYPATPLCRWAVSPHAPYSVNHEYACAQLIMGNAAIHLAESPGEVELLLSRTGPFVAFLQELGVWSPSAFTAGLTDFVPGHLRTGPPVLYVHCNYTPPELPFSPGHTVVYCPRTHAAFGHPPHPFRGMLARGVRVCLATDSLASNPDLDVLAEARFVHARAPDIPANLLLRMVTLAGAEALGWADQCGSLEMGKSADLVAVPLPAGSAADPHELLLGGDCGPRRTLFRGRWRSSSVSPYRH